MRYNEDELRKIRHRAASQMAPAGLDAIPAAVREDAVHKVGIIKRKQKQPSAAARKHDKLESSERALLLQVQAAMAADRLKRSAEGEPQAAPGTPPGRTPQREPPQQQTPPQRPSRTPAATTEPPPLLDEPTPSPAAPGAGAAAGVAGRPAGSPRAAPVHPPTLDPAMDPAERELHPVHWRRKDSSIAASSALDPGAPSFIPPWTLQPSWQPQQWQPGEPFCPPQYAHPAGLDPAAAPFPAPVQAEPGQQSTVRDLPELPLPPEPSGKRSKATEKPKLQYRMRQILKGLITVGFANARKLRQLDLLPPAGSGIEMCKLRPPDIYATLSKRSWDQELKLWRNRLHDLDFLTEELWEPEVAQMLQAREIHQLSDEQIAELVAQYDEERRQGTKSAAKRKPLRPGAAAAAAPAGAAPAAAQS